MDITKKLKGVIQDDEIKRYTKDIDTLMDKKLEKIGKLLKDKEVDLMK
jgi:ribosome recycling factor